MRNNSSIFRPAALQHYLNKRERSVFPVYAPSRTALCAVLLSVILAASVLLAVLIRVPVYARGAAVLVQQEEAGTFEVVVFMPAEVFSKLEVGQKVFLRDGATGWRDAGQIIRRDLTPDALARFRLAHLPDEVSKDSAAVALVGPLPADHANVLDVSVEIGERRLFRPFQ